MKTVKVNPPLYQRIRNTELDAQEIYRLLSLNDLMNNLKLKVDIVLDFSTHRNAPNKCPTFWGQIILYLRLLSFTE